jgi:hypothetical protein
MLLFVVASFFMVVMLIKGKGIKSEGRRSIKVSFWI